MSETYNPNPESREQPKRGCNVTVTSEWLRHAQKKSGEVLAEGQGISTSAISAEGAVQAHEVGKIWVHENNPTRIKGYVSGSARTTETYDHIVAGILEVNQTDMTKMKTRERSELTVNPPSEFLKLYGEKWAAEKQQEIVTQGIPFEQFGSLPPSQQGEIADRAENPIIKEWLENPESELAKIFPPTEAASNFAVLFNRHIHMAQHLNNGSNVELVHVTHRSIMEPFLVSGVLIDADGNSVTSFDQIGEPFESLGGFRSEVITDDQGNVTVVVILRDKKYTIDQDVLAQLVAMG